MPRPIPQSCIDLVRDQEETHLFAYDDAFYPAKEAVPGDVIRGTLTAGTGHTGHDVVVGMVVTAEMDAAWLVADLGVAADRLESQIASVAAELTDNQFASLVDFVFNVGAAPGWTIWKRLKAKQFDQVPLELAKFVNSGNPPVKSAGLVRRRNAEIALWAESEPGTSVTPIPSSVTRTADTSPTPSDPVPLSKSKGLIAGGAAAIAGASPMIDQVTHAIEPYSRHSHPVGMMLGVLATLSAICAAVAVFYMYRQKQQARN